MDPLLRKKRKEILRILGAHGATNIRVFGSRARGEARADSDIDLLIDGLCDNTRAWDVALELREVVGCPVDLVPERQLNRYRRDRILREAVPLDSAAPKIVREDINHVAADMPDDWARLRDIVDACRRLERYVAIGKARFIEDDHWQDAIVRRLEIIGEAVSKLSREHRLDWPGVPYKEMVDERNRLIHDYTHVDLEDVWTRATVDVRSLRVQVESILQLMETGREGLPESPEA